MILVFVGLLCLCAGAAIMALVCGSTLSEIQDRESVCYRPRLMMRRRDSWND